MPESEQPTSPVSVEEFQRLLNEDQAFVDEAVARMQLGEEKYGPVKFLGVDTLQEAMDEVVDLANYARMTYVKLWLLNKRVAQMAVESAKPDKQGFIPMKEFLQ
jgi:hypothetical protein